jgi:uncharacterized membrane protein
VIYFRRFLVPISFRFAIFGSFVFVSLLISSFSLRSETSEKTDFFRFEAKKICLFFASFRFNRKRTAHPNPADSDFGDFRIDYLDEYEAIRCTVVSIKFYKLYLVSFASLGVSAIPIQISFLIGVDFVSIFAVIFLYRPSRCYRICLHGLNGST